MADKSIEFWYGIAEKSVKELIHSYFARFMNINVPECYSKFVNLLKLMKEMPDGFISSTSLLYIPKKQKGVEILTDDSNDYSIELCLVPWDHKWDESKVKILGEHNVNEVKKRIGAAMNSAHLTFNLLKNQNSELNNLALVLDPENVTIRIIDCLFPDYEHTWRISWKIMRI